MRRFLVLAALALGVLTFAPAAGMATAPNNESATYGWFLEVPNVAMASNGDTIALVGEGEFGVHPKSASGGGTFTLTFAGGGSVSGTWTVNGLIDFQPYGCGVVFGEPIPPDLCGGRVVLDVTGQGPEGPAPAKVTIYCLIGSPPGSAEEGVRVVVPGLSNFNKQVEGMNVYVKQ